MTVFRGVCGVFLVVTSCATAPGPSEAELSAKVYQTLGGPSVVAGLEVSLQTDYVFERYTLVRATTTRGPSPDEVVGLSLGNGLFLDNAGNLAVRADGLLGLGPDFVGTTLWANQTVTYDGHKLVVEPSVPGPWGPQYEVVPSVSPVTLANLIVTKDASGTVRVDHRDVLVENQTWTPTAGGYIRSLPFQRTQTIVLTAQGISDDLGQLKVESRGDHLLVSYRPGAAPEYRVRVYRSSTQYLLVDDRTGETTSLALTPTSVTGPGFSLLVTNPQKR